MVIEMWIGMFDDIINNELYNFTQKCIILYLKKVPINVISKLLKKEYRLTYNIVYQFCKKNNILFSTNNNKDNNKLSYITNNKELSKAFNNLKIIK